MNESLYIYRFNGENSSCRYPYSQHKNCKLMTNKNKTKLFLIPRSSIESLASSSLQALGLSEKPHHVHPGSVGEESIGWVETHKSEQLWGPDSSWWASEEPFAIRSPFLAGSRRQRDGKVLV